MGRIHERAHEVSAAIDAIEHGRAPSALHSRWAFMLRFADEMNELAHG